VENITNELYVFFWSSVFRGKHLQSIQLEIKRTCYNIWIWLLWKIDIYTLVHKSWSLNKASDDT